VLVPLTLVLERTAFPAPGLILGCAGAALLLLNLAWQRTLQATAARWPSATTRLGATVGPFVPLGLLVGALSLGEAAPATTRGLLVGGLLGGLLLWPGLGLLRVPPRQVATPRRLLDAAEQASPPLLLLPAGLLLLLLPALSGLGAPPGGATVAPAVGLGALGLLLLLGTTATSLLDRLPGDATGAVSPGLPPLAAGPDEGSAWSPVLLLLLLALGLLLAPVGAALPLRWAGEASAAAGVLLGLATAPARPAAALRLPRALGHPRLPGGLQAPRLGLLFVGVPLLLGVAALAAADPGRPALLLSFRGPELAALLGAGVGCLAPAEAPAPGDRRDGLVLLALLLAGAGLLLLGFGGPASGGTG